MKSNLIDLEVAIRRNNPDENYIAVADGTTKLWNGRQKEFWFFLPRTEVEINDDGTITLPEWLALEKGLI